MECPDCGVVATHSTQVCDCGYAFMSVPQAEAAIGSAVTAKPGGGSATGKLRAGAREKPPGKRGRPLHRFAFHGTGGAMFGMMIVNAFLTMLTLGVYTFWAKVKVRQYTYSQLEFGKQRFAYHGTGKELFFGALKAIGIYFGVLALSMAIMLSKIPGAQVIAMLVIYGVILPLIPFAIIGARKYALSRTSLYGIRFSFRGDVKEFLKIFVTGSLLTLVTVGFYMPFFNAKMRNFMINHSYFGTRQFASNVEGKDLFKAFVIALVLSIPTCGIYMFWFMAEQSRYCAKHTTFGKAQFRSEVTGGALLKLHFVNGLMAICSFGIALPWVVARTMQFKAANLVLLGDLDLHNIKQEAQKASAGGEGMADMLDLDLGLMV